VAPCAAHPSSLPSGSLWRQTHPR